MSVCLVLVFASLIEYAAVNVMSRQRSAAPIRQPSSQQQQQQPSTEARRAPLAAAADGAPSLFKQIGSAAELSTADGQQATAAATTAVSEYGRRSCQLQAGVKLNIEARLGQVLKTHAECY